MGFDLLSDTKDCRLSAEAWRQLLELARTHGWKPEGTVPTEHTWNSKEWSGEYTTNDWQRVTASDAHSLRMALLRAKSALEVIRDLEEPNKSQAEHKVAEDPFKLGWEKNSAMIGLCEYLIKFLESGEFIIS